MGCEYEVDVAGGPATGMRARSVTIACEVCKTLQDAITYLKDLETGKDLEIAPHCNQDETHPIKPWQTNQPCPKCGEKLRKTGQIAVWS